MPDPTVPTPAAARPQVPYVRVHDGDNPAECPSDQYHLVQIVADLAYSRDRRGGSVVQLPARLSYCPVCKTWYIDRPRLENLARQGVDLRGIDIVGSQDHARPPEYADWHPLPVAQPVQTGTAPARRTPGRAAEPGGAVRKSAGGAAKVRTKPADLHLAYSCLYCDGGKNGRMYGFRGVCTQDCYYGNVTRDDESWCASPDNRCREYQPGQQADGDGLCMECRLLLDWQIRLPNDAASASLTGVSHIGGLAVATTVMPRESEANRRVVAVFLIAAQETKADGIHLIADRRLRFELAVDEPVYFWKSISSRGLPDDDAGASDQRPLNQQALVKLLHRAARAIHDADRRTVAEQLLAQASAKLTPQQLSKLLS